MEKQAPFLTECTRNFREEASDEVRNEKSPPIGAVSAADSGKQENALPAESGQGADERTLFIIAIIGDLPRLAAR